MKPAKLGFLLPFFIFCSLTALGLSGVSRVTKMLCNEFKDVCNMEMDPGNCYEVHLKYFYNRTSKECQSFVFNGCDGNLNNFNLKIECDITCNENYRKVRYTPPPPVPTTTLATPSNVAAKLLESRKKKYPPRARKRSRKPQKSRKHRRSRRHPRARHHI